MRKPRSTCLVFIAGILLTHVAMAQRVAGGASLGAQPDPARLERLEALSDVWGRLYLLHPFAAQPELDWNRILVAAIGPAERATSPADFSRVLNDNLFSRLGDPMAFAQLHTPATGEWSRCAPTPVATRRVANSVVLIDVSDPRTPCSRGFPPKFARAIRDAEGSELVIIDLRWPSEYPGDAFGREGWLSLFLGNASSTGLQLSREHLGWTDEPPGQNQWFGQHWRIEVPASLRPPGDSASTLRDLYPSDSLLALNVYRGNVVILVNNGSLPYYEPILNALSGQPNVAVVYQRTGAFTDNGATRYLSAIDVRFHLTALVASDGALGYRPDLVVDQAVSSADLPATARRALAAKALQRQQRRDAFQFRLPAPSRWPYSEAPPSREERVAGVISVWAVLDRFFPYWDYADIDWSKMLRDWIPRAERAPDIGSYYRVLNEIVSRLKDAHASARHPRMGFLGGFGIAAKVMLVQRRPVVVEIAPTVGRTDADLRVGDEILSVDGRSIEATEAFYRPLYSAPHDPIAFMWSFDLPFRGPENTVLALTVRRVEGVRSIQVRRSINLSESYDTTTVRRLAGDIGYINLRAIPSAAALDSALDNFDRTSVALILDLRGYPNRAAMSPISRRFPPRAALVSAHVAVVQRGIPRVAVDHGGESRTFIPRPSVAFSEPGMPFSKPVVVLIDGRAGSAAESYGLGLEAAANVTMVGMPTVGTDGTPTFLSLPGGGNLRFTGERWVRDDGSRFHGIGIVPAVRAEPTLAGIRSGRDEVLERGIVVLRAKLAHGRP